MQDKAPTIISEAVVGLRGYYKLNLHQDISEKAVTISLQATYHAQDITQRFALDEVVHRFLSSPSKVLLLWGDTNAGKSFYCQYLINCFWQTYQTHKRTPLLITLSDVKDRTHGLIEAVLANQGCSTEIINALKAGNHPFLFIVDYGKHQPSQNLYVTNQLATWNAQVIITCGRQYLTNVGRYDKYFMPYDNKVPQPWLLTVASITSLSDKQITGYLQQYVAQYAPSISWQDYQDYIDKLDIRQLVGSPFLLSVVAQRLPDILAQYQVHAVSEHLSLIRETLIDVLMRHWFKHQQAQLIKEGQLNAEGDTFLQRCWHHCQMLAQAMQSHGATQVYYKPRSSLFKPVQVSPWSVFFSTETALVRSVCPIKAVAPHHYAFIYTPLREYFANRPMEAELIDQPISTGPTSQTVIKDSDSKVISQEQLGWLQLSINKRLFADEFGMLGFMADEVYGNKAYEKRLFAMVELSKNPQVPIVVGAANAISVLNVARVPFSALDLSDIRVGGIPVQSTQDDDKADALTDEVWRGANLDHGIFDGTNLQRADIRGVSLRDPFLRNTQLQGADLRGVRFYQRPHLQHEDEINDMVFFPDGKTLAVAAGRDITLWDIASGEKKDKLHGHSDEVICLAYSLAGVQLVTGSLDGAVILWDTATGEQVGKLAGHSKWVTCMAYSPNGLQLATGSRDTTVILWEAEAKTGKQMRVLTGHSEWETLAYSLDGLQLATGGNDGAGVLWDTKTGKQVRKLAGHSKWVTCLAYSLDSTQLATGSTDGTVILWNLTTGEIQGEVLAGHSMAVHCLAYSLDGTQLATGSMDETIILWDTATGKQIDVLQGHSAMVNCLAYSTDGLLATGSFDKRVIFWQMGTDKQQIHDLRGHSYGVSCLAYSPGGKQLATGGRDKRVILWDTQTGKQIGEALSGHSNDVICLAYSPDGTQLATGSFDKMVVLWNTQTGNQVALVGHDGWVTCLAFSLNGKQLATGSHDKRVILWDTQTGKQIRDVRGHNDRVDCLAYLPGGTQLATGSMDKRVILWDTQTGKQVCDLRGHNSGVTCIAHSPDGTQLATGSDDGAVILWDTQMGKQILDLRGHNGGVYRLAFSPNDGKQLATTGDRDKRVILWNMQTGQQMRDLLGHSYKVSCLTYSPDGEQLATGSEDWTVILWDTQTGKQVCDLRGHNGGVTCLAYSPDGTKLATGSFDKTIRVWNLQKTRKGIQGYLQWTSGGLTLFSGSTRLDGCQISASNKRLLLQKGAQEGTEDREVSVISLL